MLAVVLALLVVVGMPAASSATSSARSNDPRAEREKVRAQKAGVAADVDALRATEAEVAAALAAITENVRGQQAAYADAQRLAVEAQDRAAAAAAAVLVKEAEISELRLAIAEFSVQAYVNPPTEEMLDNFREGSANEATVKKSLMSFRSGRDGDILDRLKSAEADLVADRDKADAARVDAQSRVATVESQLTALQAAQSQQQQFADDVDSRLDARLHEAEELAATDAALSAEILKQEEAVAAQMRAMQKASSSRNSGGGGGGSTPVAIPSAPGLTTVGGIQVNSSIASNLQGLLAAASADGITLTGTGYRPPTRQIELRRQNCGSSDYAIYQMSPSGCSPMTARPGTSNHERGLAIDFNFGNGSAEHRWMQANAGRYGWLPLAGEHWHWSVGGG